MGVWGGSGLWCWGTDPVTLEQYISGPSLASLVVQGWGAQAHMGGPRLAQRVRGCPPPLQGIKPRAVPGVWGAVLAPPCSCSPPLIPSLPALCWGSAPAKSWHPRSKALLTLPPPKAWGDLRRVSELSAV